jgi:hypothetical protein
LEEFSFRFNNRKAPDLFGMTVRRMAAVGAMPYGKLVEENDVHAVCDAVNTPKGPMDSGLRQTYWTAHPDSSWREMQGE